MILSGKSRITWRQNKVPFWEMNIFYLMIINNSAYSKDSISKHGPDTEPLGAINKSKKLATLKMV